MIAVALLALVALRFALLAQLYRGGFVALSADDFARVVVAARWAEDGASLTHGPWLPLHFWILGAALHLDWNLVWTPRVVAIVAGVLAIPCIYAIGTRLGGRAAGLVAALALAVSPSHVWLGATPLSEGLYATLWLGAVLSAMHWRDTRRGVWLLAAALLLAAADAVRFEGWIVSALLVALLAFELYARRAATGRIARSELALAALATLLVTAVPIAWTISDARATGAVLGFLHEIERYKTDFATRARAFPAGPGTWASIALALDPLVLPGALFGALALARERHRIAGVGAYAVLGCAPLLVFLAAQYGEPDPWINHLRYVAPFLWMLLPLAGCGVVAVARAMVAPPWLRSALAACCLLIAVRQSWRALDPPHDASGAGVALGRALAALRDPGDPGAVLVDADGFEGFAVHAGLGDVRGLLYESPLDRLRSSAVYAAVGDDWQEPWSGGCGGLDGFVPDRAGLLRCARAHDVRWLALRAPAAREVAERGLGLVPRARVAGWTVYPVPRATTLARSEGAP